MADELWMISVDDHVIEPPDVWQSRLPARFAPEGPRVVSCGRGEAWLFEGKTYPVNGKSAVAGLPQSEWRMGPVPFAELPAAAYEPRAREQAMLSDGVVGSLLFPTFPRFCGQLFSEAADKDLGLACIRAYNDWMIDEWCGSVPGRFIPMVIIPLWDPERAAAEIRRGAARGARAVAFSENPVRLGFPSIHDRSRYWDPVFAAADEAELPLCAHLGSSSQLTITAPDAPPVITPTLPFVNSMSCLADWMFSGHFQRYPSLRLCLSEGGIGWIPVYLHRVARVVESQAEPLLRVEASGLTIDDVMAAAAEDLAPVPAELLARTLIDPYEMFAQHVYGCFIDDPVGLRLLEFLPVDNIMIETDYPHPDSSFPHSRQMAAAALAELSPDAQSKILRDNAQRLFRFTPTPPPEDGRGPEATAAASRRTTPP
jgi:predicted TIM-barrel fold metal-dependent hydrolase